MYLNITNKRIFIYCYMCNNAISLDVAEAQRTRNDYTGIAASLFCLFTITRFSPSLVLSLYMSEG